MKRHLLWVCSCCGHKEEVLDTQEMRTTWLPEPGWAAFAARTGGSLDADFFCPSCWPPIARAVHVAKRLKALPQPPPFTHQE